MTSTSSFMSTIPRFATGLWLCCSVALMATSWFVGRLDRSPRPRRQRAGGDESHEYGEDRLFRCVVTAVRRFMGSPFGDGRSAGPVQRGAPDRWDAALALAR